MDIETLSEINVLKETERQKISVVVGADGKRYLRRDMLNEKREIYKALSDVNHVGVPKIFHVSLTDRTTVIEEYINGIPLSEYIEKNKLGKGKLRSLAIKLISAVEAIHGENIIHRDIKPQNVLIDRDGNIYLVDYDIARIERNELKKDTDTLGTFGYAPIEQFGIMPTNKKTDIYAFGMTLKTLLDRFGVKGNLYRIAKKCTRLDPDQRYESASAVKRALRFGKVKNLLISAVLVLCLAVGVLIYNTLKQPTRNTNIPKTELSLQDEPQNIPDEVMADEIPQPEEATTETLTSPEEDWRRFRGFEKGDRENGYYELRNNGAICTFATDFPYEHIIFAEDMRKTGTIILGKNETPVKADVSLNNGVLTLSLDDGKGHRFNHKFYYQGNHQYTAYQSSDMRKNADLMCYDFDGNGCNELLVGLNECALTVNGGELYSSFNYSVGWCICYDEQNGFTLCQGDMFSVNSSFAIYSNNDGVVNSHWVTADQPVGYYMKDNMIMPLF